MASTMLREHAFDSVMERRLFSLALRSAAERPDLDLPAGNFVCLLAWDAREASAETISALVEPLLRAGASYFVCWGPECERVHDVIDGMLAASRNDFGIPDDSCIMTTWHGSEPLSEALWYFLACSMPDDYYINSTNAGLAVSVGSSSWAAEIAAALEHP